MSRTSYLPFGRPDFGAEEIEAVTRVMRSGWVGMGPETIAFENELAGFMGASEVVSVNSCTSALFLSHFSKGALENQATGKSTGLSQITTLGMRSPEGDDADAGSAAPRSRGSARADRTARPSAATSGSAPCPP